MSDTPEDTHDNDDTTWDEGLTQEEKNETAKFLWYRHNAPNDIRSPEGAFTAHDSLRVLCGLVMTGLPKDDKLVEEVSRLHDVVEDHERLLTLVIELRELILTETRRLGGTGGIFNAGTTREQLLAALTKINGEASRLYLSEI